MHSHNVAQHHTTLQRHTTLQHNTPLRRTRCGVLNAARWDRDSETTAWERQQHGWWSARPTRPDAAGSLAPRHQQDCHFADALASSLWKQVTNAEGGAADLLCCVEGSHAPELAVFRQSRDPGVEQRVPGPDRKRVTTALPYSTGDTGDTSDLTTSGTHALH